MTSFFGTLPAFSRETRFSARLAVSFAPFVVPRFSRRPRGPLLHAFV